MSLWGHGEYLPLTPSLWKLPQSVTSLVINTSVVTFVQIRDMVELPGLDDLSLSGIPVPMDRRELPRIGTTLRGRFGGRLHLSRGGADEDVVNMLLEVPTGLHFTGVRIYATHECHLLSTVRLAEACGKTLVKLLYSVVLRGKSHPSPGLAGRIAQIINTDPFSDVDGSGTFERSFDFSKFPNIQEVDFRVGWMGGGLLWIPTALSALGPTTSPRLSAINLGLSSPLAHGYAETAIEEAWDDLRWIADEAMRIERGFEGTAKFTARPYREFTVVFKALNVRFHFYGVNDAS